MGFRASAIKPAWGLGKAPGYPVVKVATRTDMVGKGEVCKYEKITIADNGGNRKSGKTDCNNIKTTPTAMTNSQCGTRNTRQAHLSSGDTQTRIAEAATRNKNRRIDQANIGLEDGGGVRRGQK